MSERPGPGANVEQGGVRFSAWSSSAERIWVSLFDGEFHWIETDRIELEPVGGGVYSIFVPGICEGMRCGLRADGRHDPPAGYWFDPDKLLMDPFAVAIDRPYVYDPRLAARRGEGGDTAPLIPKAIVTRLPAPVASLPPVFQGGGLIYEINVRAFTMLHPDVPKELRGTVAALAHPAVVAHLRKLGVSAIELMPVTASMDERHLVPLGLTNAWGYNPVTFMALDPRLAPGGIAELREAVAVLRGEGIGVILDLVFNHTAESDVLGPTLSLRGLDNQAYYRHGPDGSLVNDTGCGNTIRCNHPVVRRMILDTLRHFVLNAGVDGFRFDLAPILGRTESGFDPDAALFAEIAADPVLADRVLIAEPWDIGPGGYQLGNFPSRWLEWNDRCRDDLRRFWRGDAGMLGALATRLSGSSDIFARGGAATTRSVNFLAAHDGMTLADLTAYEAKHNEANGEQNRDGHDENLSWNNGVEGAAADESVHVARRRDVRALLATLFATRGAIMLTAGDEFGRTQKGNNNAYAQDNSITWLDWAGRDAELQDYATALSRLRSASAALRRMEFLQGVPDRGTGLPDVEWLDRRGAPMTANEWEAPENRRLTMLLAEPEGGRFSRIAVMINGDRRGTIFALPQRPGRRWREWEGLGTGDGSLKPEPPAFAVAGRSVGFAVEIADEGAGGA